MIILQSKELNKKNHENLDLQSQDEVCLIKEHILSQTIIFIVKYLMKQNDIPQSQSSSQVHRKEGTDKHQFKQEEEGDLTLRNSKIAMMEEHFQRQLNQRDDRIATLEQEIRQLVKEFTEQKKDNQERQRQYRYTIQRLEDVLRREESHRKTLEERLHKVETIVGDFEEKQMKFGPKIEKLISHHTYNSHQEYYKLTSSTINSAKIERVGGINSFYNFVNKAVVAPKKQARYTIKLANTQGSHLLIGFCTENGLGKMNNCSNTESVYYYCFGKGYLYQEGFWKQLSDCGSIDGDIVQCVADLMEDRLCWLKGEKVLTVCKIPASMKDKPIYLSILLHFPGNSVEVSLA